MATAPPAGACEVAERDVFGFCPDGTLPSSPVPAPVPPPPPATDMCQNRDIFGFCQDGVASPSESLPPMLETLVGLVSATETGSGGETYSFTLSSRQTVNISLTGMNGSIDCSIDGDPDMCSNNRGAADDSWTVELAAGLHTLTVYPDQSGTGDYTITATVACPPGHFASGGSCYAYVTANSEGGDDGQVRTCDENTELEPGQSCVNGIVVDEKIDVNGTPIPIETLRRPRPTPTPTPTPQPPPPPSPPTWVTPLMKEQLKNAVGDAITRSQTCRVRTNSGDVKTPNAELTTARDVGRIILGGLDCPNGYAYANSIPGDTIRVCEPFFDLSAPDRSLTIMHEGLHLNGVKHTDFGVNTAPGDGGPMDDAIRSACGY